ncbi:hypothetical protein F7984_18640 [Pradoshia sp. D12]|uniref:hypothetical protein n=1 Tax=Bacillaceae TaxID=186817 RepID=UPI00080AD55F|nr:MULTISPECIES: hypothetical protein [Bacillaceae]OCA81172.1 hypothetical protein A8L44_15925 [Bacillus sp. FJAT-27986]QFK73103.1 hypothetical protein F7984_18640 [Pradoshia sp. D12]TPF72095.1 hypothetical protein FHY44_11335 [Bacillus sp. D12]
MEYIKYEKRKNWTFRVVLLLLAISVIYAIYMLINAPSGVAQNEYERVKSDYVLMILQCLTGCIVIFLPSQLEHRFRIDIPDIMEIMYFIFLFCAIYLGEVRNFYYKVPYWDLILHCFSAAMLGALGFIIVNFLNNTKKTIDLSPFFVALFAFCFAITCGTVWEIYEFLADGVLGTNMQKFITGEGVVLIGRDAVMDTMGDIIVDALGAFTVTAIGYINLKKQQKSRIVEEEEQKMWIESEKTGS